MSRVQGIAARLRAALFRRAADRRAREEFAFHLEMETAANVRRGLPPDEARRRALAAFGGVERHRDDLRDLRAALPDDLGRDVRIAWRSLRATPAFMLATVASLAFGLALAASAAAVVHAYLGRTALPYAHADRLYHVMYAPPGPVEPHGMSTLDWSTLRDVVRDAVTSQGVSYTLGEGADAQALAALRVSFGFVRGLGVRATIGRPLVADDYASDADGRAALISDALWRGRFGADSRVLGRRLRVEVEGHPGTFETLHVVGVMAPGFWYGRTSDTQVDVLTPLRTHATTYVVRLRDDVTAERAARRLTEAVRAAATWIPPDWPGVTVEGMQERYVREMRPRLVAIAVAAGLVLAITCVNVAVLTLLRTMRRGRDVAVRVMLGAGRASLLRLHLVEIGMLCGAALAGGVALTAAALRALAPRIEAELGKPAPAGPSAIGVDWTVLALVGGVSVLIALLLACVPALLPWQRRLAESLRRAGRAGSDGPVMRRARSTLVALEIAGSLALVAGCGLMIRSAVAMIGTDLGYDTAGIVRVRVRLRQETYPDAAAFQRFYARLAERMAAAGGPRPAYASWPPYADVPTQTVDVDGRAGEGVAGGVVAVGDGYFATLGIALRKGRALTDADRVESEPVAVVSETLARRLWPNGDALGRRIRPHETMQPGAAPAPWRTVVGVVADVRQTYVDADANDVYIPYYQNPQLGRYGSFYLRARGTSPGAAARMARAAVAEVDPRAIVRDVLTVDDEDRELASARFMTSLLTGFAAFAALLATLGIYGVVAYAAQQRQRELAIRMAVGATRPAVVGLFVRDSGAVVGAGLALGVLAALAVARVLAHQLYGVGPFDAATLAASCAVMAVVALVAVWWPASRATARSPVTVLSEP
ncbi:MacB-like periplasmic core domain protein (plasmid) [Gemmatirosa kalamazoonensis]|uniref:MacB-like periplasmic core domain protein n=1 Tax=Gemmatirosa kalamazoonensis TaxID=861299 RepID=W0RQ48_9BACT|nr:ABC transporter permease [Gemmatirosa kalamazoonensis]AHG92465.1 MacB-like periplasmic core domain protein [Gemmatirosa kalamazoonensis]